MTVFFYKLTLNYSVSQSEMFNMHLGHAENSSKRWGFKRPVTETTTRLDYRYPPLLESLLYATSLL